MSLFFNGWNEWREGAYLEPDEDYGFQYLEVVRDAKDKAEREVLNGIFVLKNVKLAK